MSTNAAKYGALSTRRGNIDVTWQVGSDKSVELIWREHGGPKVKATGSGLGTRLIDHVIRYDLDGTTKIDFDPAGVCWTISFSVGDHASGRGALSNSATT
jgi:two-component sensor histidine kinase